MRIIIFILLLVFYSCKATNNNASKKILDFGSFTIEAPINWTKIKVQGVDDYVGKIAIDNNDTIEFNLGFFANPLEQPEPEDYYGNSPEKYCKSKILWDSVDNHKAKILTPKKPGTGMTGIYFDSLWKEGEDIVRFNLVGQDLKKANEKLVLQAFKTLRFRQKN